MVSSFRGIRRAAKYLSAITLTLLISASLCAAQSGSGPVPDTQLSNDLDKYPGLLPEFAHLFDKLRQNLQFPPPRNQSRLLPLVPESTVVYGAFPNYGEVSHQALGIFHEELQQSPVLRNWWLDTNASGAGKIEEALQGFYQLSQYLGDEVVISGAKQGKEPSVVVIAEIRKPGLKDFLEQKIEQLAPGPRPPIRVLGLRELPFAKEAPGHQPFVLVRPDFVVAASDLITLRALNAQLTRNNTAGFASSAFGQRLERTYGGGTSVLGGADLETILTQLPKDTDQKADLFRETGFSDLKYLVWEHKTVAGREFSQAELSFTGPRRGVAAWLAPPRTLGSLDFVSPHPMLAASLALTSPAQIYDDLRQLSTASNPNSFAMIDFMQQAAGMQLKEDLLSRLTGEITIEVDSALPPAPVWRLVLGVNDPGRLRHTLITLLASSHLQPDAFDEAGVTYYNLTAPSPARPVAISYAFVDGYLVVGSSHEAVAEAVRLHRSGESLAKSQSFQASLPPGHPSGISGLFYENPAALMAMRLSPAAPGIEQSLAPLLSGQSPVVLCAYGDESAIREVTTSTVFDPAAAMVLGAVAIPNVLRARMAANESSAVSTLRSVNAAQIAYAAQYPPRGFAPDLASLGPDSAMPQRATASHAALIDPTLGNISCTAATWCEKSGFRFRVTGICTQDHCRDFVAMGTPVAGNMGGRSFCSTSDDVIHQKPGPPLASPVTALECRSWPPLQ